MNNEIAPMISDSEKNSEYSRTPSYNIVVVNNRE